MWILILLAGTAAVVGGILLIRNFEEAYSSIREFRELLLGERATSKHPQPEVLRRVGVAWIVFGTVFILVAVLALSGAVKFPLR